MPRDFQKRPVLEVEDVLRLCWRDKPVTELDREDLLTALEEAWEEIQHWKEKYQEWKDRAEGAGEEF